MARIIDRVFPQQQGLTLIELMLTCGMLALVTLIAVVRLSSSYRNEQDAETTASQIQHALELAKETARHNRIPVRLVWAVDPAPCYWLEENTGTTWQSISEKTMVANRASFSGDPAIEFQAGGTTSSGASILIQVSNTQRQIMVAPMTGKIALYTP